MYFCRNEKAFICNHELHWITIRKLGKQVCTYMYTCTCTVSTRKTGM